MTEAVLRDMRDRCMNMPSDAKVDMREWLRGLAEGSGKER
jgi:hypothetical protein